MAGTPLTDTCTNSFYFSAAVRIPLGYWAIPDLLIDGEPYVSGQVGTNMFIRTRLKADHCSTLTSFKPFNGAKNWASTPFSTYTVRQVARMDGKRQAS